MTKVSFKDKLDWKGILSIIISVVVGILGGYGFSLTISQDPETKEIIVETNNIELSEDQTRATLIENENGDIEEIEAVTVEAVENNQSVVECGEDEECGQGWYVDTSSPQAFKNAVYNSCVDTDGHYGSQCWDLGNLFWQNYAGRTLSTCGTGAAKGAWSCKEQNAGDEFELITDPTSLQAGDWIIFTNGTYGHIGMAMGSYNDGYIALLGTNQGGASCSGGGSSANIINISLKNFGGAFRPKSYSSEPGPIIPISGCVKWHVEQGDTMSKIMLDCENTIVYGEAMNNYAKTWYSLIYKPGQSVYDGWQSKSGVGLYAGDDIEHRTE